MKYIQRNILMVIALLPLLVAACIAEDRQGEERPPVSEKIRFELFTKTDSYGVPVTRATANEDEVDKETLWVLVFLGSDDNATFVEAVQTEQIGAKSYVTLTPQTSRCQLLVLANSNTFYMGNTGYALTLENLKTAFSGKTLYDVSAMLSVPLNSPQTEVPFLGRNIPMSALVTVDKIELKTAIPIIVLKRAVGKIMVNNFVDGFTLKGITTVMNTPKQARLYNPYDELSYNTNPDKVVEYRSAAGYGMDFVTVSDNSTESIPIYVYESECGEYKNDTYLIIRANYKGEDCFYKMAFVNDARDQLNILRNTEYHFFITAVNERGYSTVEDAKASKASNAKLRYSVKVADNSSYEIMATDDYYVGVTNSHLELYAKNNNTVEYTAFSLITNGTGVYPNKITSLTDGMTIVGGSMIPTGVFHDVKIKVEDDVYLGEIELQLGSFRKIITVRRFQPVSMAGMTIGWFHPNDLNYLSAYVVDYPMTDGYPNASHWLQLSPGGGAVRNDPHQIYVDTGAIDLHIGNGGGAAGDVYVSTNNIPTRRIKVHITQQ